MDELKEYLREQFKRTAHPKYRHLFEEWYKNLTDAQRMYFNAYKDGKKSPFV